MEHALQKNALDYLLGKNDKLEYYTDMDNYQEGTQRIVDYWIDRWLASRLKYAPIYERIENFNQRIYLLESRYRKRINGNSSL